MRGDAPLKADADGPMPSRKAKLEGSRLQTASASTKNKKALLITVALCFVFMIAEAVGGIIAGSLAVLTDAAHMLTDVAAISLSLVSMQVATRLANAKYSYGWQRAETVGALGSVFLIWALVGGIFLEAVRRIISTVHCAKSNTDVSCEGIDAQLMFGLGWAGLVINIIIALTLLLLGGHGHGHTHGHGHSSRDIQRQQDDRREKEKASLLDSPSYRSEGNIHHSSDEVHKEDSVEPHGGEGATGNLNVRGALLHALGDCIQSIGVVVAATIIWIVNKHQHGTANYPHSYANIVDPLCSVLFGVITLFTTITLARDLFRILMEGTPAGIDYDEIMRTLERIECISGIHDLHIWALTPDKIVLSVHVVSDCHALALAQTNQVCAKYGISHTTVQVEPSCTDSTQCSGNFSCAN